MHANMIHILTAFSHSMAVKYWLCFGWLWFCFAIGHFNTIAIDFCLHFIGNSMESVGFKVIQFQVISMMKKKHSWRSFVIFFILIFAENYKTDADYARPSIIIKKIFVMFTCTQNETQAKKGKRRNERQMCSQFLQSTQTNEALK